MTHQHDASLSPCLPEAAPTLQNRSKKQIIEGITIKKHRFLSWSATKQGETKLTNVFLVVEGPGIVSNGNQRSAATSAQIMFVAETVVPKPASFTGSRIHFELPISHLAWIREQLQRPGQMECTYIELGAVPTETWAQIASPIKVRR